MIKMNIRNQGYIHLLTNFTKGFSGFHRIEFGLFSQKSVEGLTPVVQKLQSDIATLKQQLLAQSIAPEQLASMIVRTMRSLAEIRSNGEEERYSHIDVTGFAANLEGTRKVIELLRPLLAKTSGDVLKKIDSATTGLDDQLLMLKTDSGFKPYDQVSAEQRKQIADKAKALADALDGIDPALGLSGL